MSSVRDRLVLRFKSCSCRYLAGCTATPSIRIETLDVDQHAQLFELWPTDGERRPQIFRLNPTR